MYTPGVCSILSALLKLEKLSLTIFVWPGFIINSLSSTSVIPERPIASTLNTFSLFPKFITLNSFSRNSSFLTNTLIKIWSISKGTVLSSATILSEIMLLF